jgi:hypothetical protein
MMIIRYSPRYIPTSSLIIWMYFAYHLWYSTSASDTVLIDLAYKFAVDNNLMYVGSINRKL